MTSALVNLIGRPGYRTFRTFPGRLDGVTDPDPVPTRGPDGSPLGTEGRPGLRDEYPRPSGIGAAVAVGGLWGVLCYSVLWEGTPFEVDRAFVQSVPGSLALLPARLVLWAIRGIEVALGRTFDLADNHLWIGLTTSIVGAVLALAVFLTARAVVRRSRRGSLPRA
jgi:hypothetical protein